MLGDGVTHYYHQGPVFEGDKWDPNETVNFKDRGPSRARTSRRSPVLSGALLPATRRWSRPPTATTSSTATRPWFTRRRGRDRSSSPGSTAPTPQRASLQGTGYPPDFYSGMRLVFFADTSTNPGGLHVFGNEDMRVALPENAQVPSTTTSCHPRPASPSSGSRRFGLYRGGYHGRPARAREVAPGRERDRLDAVAVSDRPPGSSRSPSSASAGPCSCGGDDRPHKPSIARSPCLPRSSPSSPRAARGWEHRPTPVPNADPTLNGTTSITLDYAERARAPVGHRRRRRGLNDRDRDRALRIEGVALSTLADRVGGCERTRRMRVMPRRVHVGPGPAPGGRNGLRGLFARASRSSRTRRRSSRS